MFGFAKTLLLATQLAAIANATPTANDNNGLAPKKWPDCTMPTKAQVKRTPTEKRGTVVTPLPMQSGMVGNCDKFCYVVPGSTCYEIARDNHIDLADFYKWNTGTGADCQHLWAKTYACVGVEK